MSNGEVQFSVKELLQDLYKKVSKMIEVQQEIKEALIQKVDRHEVEALRDRVIEVESKIITHESLDSLKSRLRRHSIAVWALIATLLIGLVDTALRVFKR